MIRIALRLALFPVAVAATVAALVGVAIAGAGFWLVDLYAELA